MSVRRTRPLQCELGQRGQRSLLSAAATVVFCRISVLLLVAPLLVAAPCSENPAAISVEMQPRLALIMS